MFCRQKLYQVCNLMENVTWCTYPHSTAEHLTSRWKVMSLSPGHIIFCGKKCSSPPFRWGKLPKNCSILIQYTSTDTKTHSLFHSQLKPFEPVLSNMDSFFRQAGDYGWVPTQDRPPSNSTIV